VLVATASLASGAVIVPTGFTVSTFNITVGGSAVELDGFAQSAGGAFGTSLYAAVNGGVLQINPSTGAASQFASGLSTGSNRPSGLAFDNGAFGTGNLYVSQNDGSVAVVTPAGGASTFSSGGTLFSSNDLAFAPLGSAFGNRLFVTNGDFGSGNISSVTSAGVNAVFAATSQFAQVPIGAAFAPSGSAFGGNLFTSVANGTISQVNSSGQATTFSTSGNLGLAIDLAFGQGGFGDNLYVSDPITQSIFRVTPGGVVSSFATGFAFTSSGFDADVAFSPDGRTMYVANNTQLVEITAPGAAIPEPTSVVLLGTGLAAVLGVACYRRKAAGARSGEI
jgi:hypothetical protein